MTSRIVNLENSQSSSFSSNTPSATACESIGVELVSANQLCGEIGECWKAIRAGQPKFSTPYFDMEFTKAVAQVRDDVEIAIVKDEQQDGTIIGFLPFQRISDYHAEPVGGRLNDVHGLMSGLTNCDKVMAKVMKASKLRSFSFHAGLRDQDENKYEFESVESHYIDLSDGWDAYHSWARKNSKAIKRQGQKTRGLERDLGPLRFEFDHNGSDLLEQLIDLKRAKYQRTKTFDILSVDWAANLLREISTTDKPGFKGLLSALWAGDHLVALHFGMLTENSVHYWFPTFDVNFSKYSPGTELILRVAETAASQGIAKIDFGYGDDAYKFRFCNGKEELGCGRFTFSNVGFEVAKRRYLIRKKLKDIPLKPLAKSVLRGVFPKFGQWNFK